MTRRDMRKPETSERSRLLPAWTTATLVAALLLVPLPAEASPVAPADYCLGQCGDILTPGENGNATIADIQANQSQGVRPPHFTDQLGPYTNLVAGYAGLTDTQISQFYNDSSFGVPPGQVERTERPRPDVTIVRDKATGVPHVTGSTRDGTMFGAGYAGAEDRLFVMDILRHAGRGDLTSFAGGSAANQQLEQGVWRTAPYREADLQVQAEALRKAGPRGAQAYHDSELYLAGVNAYRSACLAADSCPGEYALSGHIDPATGVPGPLPFQMTDAIAMETVIGGLFGGGGGAEMQSALVRIAARAKYGPVAGDQVWTAFREQNDPEAVTTLHDGQSFPYGDGPTSGPGVAMPDAGSATVEPIVSGTTGSATGRSVVAPGAPHTGMSNAVVISAKHSATGHPIAVFGPQTGYFSPELLMLEELQGPGISARGVAFAGLNQYVSIGRGVDYAWSATSAIQDITDTFAVPLCTVDGSAPTMRSDHYRYHGQCLPFEVLSQTNSWKPSAADSTPAGSYTLTALRSRYGLVGWRGRVKGKPVAFTQLRATYRHESLDAIGFQMFNDPAVMGDTAGFMAGASQIGSTYNWFYVNATDSAYFNSGFNPVRSAGSNPNLPITADPAYEWKDWSADTNVAAYTPRSAHPQAVDQDYFVSWNNKQADDYSAADGNFSLGAVHRADLLDARVKQAIAGGTPLSRAGVVRLVEDAALTDLRGASELDLLLRVLTSTPITDPALAADVSSLRSWKADGGERVETSPGSRVYRHADAIRLFDAWWPRLVSGVFAPGLGQDLYQALVNTLQIDDSPQSHHGSSFQYGWWGYLDKDLRAVLGADVQGGLVRRFCGGGTVAGCRAVLLQTLGAAAAAPADVTYPGDSVCTAGDQWCADAIVHAPLGAIAVPLVTWQNRPTYQQAVSFPAHRG
jgi:acyl-homoserine lactone acylase PvdQ